MRIFFVPQQRTFGLIFRSARSGREHENGESLGVFCSIRFVILCLFDILMFFFFIYIYLRLWKTRFPFLLSFLVSRLFPGSAPGRTSLAQPFLAVQINALASYICPVFTANEAHIDWTRQDVSCFPSFLCYLSHGVSFYEFFFFVVLKSKYHFALLPPTPTTKLGLKVKSIDSN